MLAHAGEFTWDEILIVLAPHIVIAALLWRVKRCVRGQRMRSMSAPKDANLPTKSS